MPLLRHSPGVEVVPYPAMGDRYRAVCGCGWKAKAKVYNLPKDEAAALKAAEQHAGMKGCGKVRYASKAEAQDVLLKAKIARGIEGNSRRQEQRVYCCPDCPDAAWHLTSQADYRETA